MRRAQKDLLVSSAAMIAAVAALEIAFRGSELRRGLDAEDIFTARVAQHSMLAEDPDVVVMGNSRTRHGVDTAVIADLVGKDMGRRATAWSFGMGRATAVPQLAFALRSLDRPRPPLVVAMCVSPTNFVDTPRPDLDHKSLVKVWKLRDLPSVIRAGATPEEALTVAAASISSLLSNRVRLLEILMSHRSPGPAERVDVMGYAPLDPVAPASQAARAMGRAAGYRKDLVGPSIGLSGFKLGCLREAIRRLRAAGVAVVVVNSPASGAVRALDGEPGSLVPAYLEAVKGIASSMGVPFFDHEAPPGMTDADFTDGDHLSRTGAARYTGILVREAILPALGPRR